jgi:hypothetical protein
MYANFPAGLSIFHSDSSSHTQAEELTDVLSADAQDTAIAKYGIAGKVWYIPPLATFHRRERTPTGRRPTR